MCPAWFGRSEADPRPEGDRLQAGLAHAPVAAKVVDVVEEHDPVPLGEAAMEAVLPRPEPRRSSFRRGASEASDAKPEKASGWPIL